MKLRTLVLCEDCWHPADMVQRGLAALAEPRFDFQFVTEGDKWSSALMADSQVLIVAKANQRNATDPSPWLTPQNQVQLRQFVRRGGGLFVIHSGTAGYGDLIMMRETTGGVFARHPDQCPVTVRPVAPHILTRGVHPFTTQDEQYFMVLDDLRAEIFLHSSSAHGEQPAGWTRTEGQGRVCVLTPGHNSAVWLHPEFQKLLRNGLNWVTAGHGHDQHDL